MVSRKIAKKDPKQRQLSLVGSTTAQMKTMRITVPDSERRWCRIDWKKWRNPCPLEKVPRELLYKNFIFQEDVMHPQLIYKLEERLGKDAAEIVRRALY